MRTARRECRAGTSVLAFCIVFIALLVLPAAVSADSFVGGLPLTTVQTGTVSGDLWFDATPAPDWGDKIVTKTFVLPSAAVAETGRIKWARLYISVYSGHMQNDYAFTVTNSWDGDGVSGYEQVWPETGHAAFLYVNESEAPYGPLGNDNSALGGGYHDPYKMINDHENRVTSDYFMWYDVSSMISNETVFVNVDSTGSFDGRIKMITLVVAYDDPNSVTQTTYWVNQGHDVCSYYTETNSYEAAVGTTTFGTTGLTGVTSAILTADYLASNNGYYGFPTSLNDFTIDYPPPDYEATVIGNFTNVELDRVADDQGPYSGLDSWDVTSSVTGSSDSTFGYARYFPGSGTAAFFKIPLAFLVVKSPLPAEAPVAQFAADVVSGTAPLTVTFVDQSTNDPTSWTWDFGDSSTSMEQNPSHEYTVAGTYTVTLTATNSAGYDVEEKTGYVTVTPATGGLADSAWPKFHANARNTGLSPYNGPQTGNLLWTYTAGTSLNILGGSPVIGSDGTVYEGSYDGKLYALNPDGTLKWSYTSGGRIYGSPAIGSDGTIYFGSFDNLLYALNSDGTLKWTYTTGGQIRGSPAIGPDGTIYAGSLDNKLYAINADGTLKWSYTTGGYVQAYGGPAIGPDGTIYAGSDDNILYAINADGTLKWSYTASSDLSSSPAIGSDGTVYIFQGGDAKTLHAINPDGTVRWTLTGIGTTGDASYSSPAIAADGTLYVGTNDYNIYAINPDGSLKWTYATGSYIFGPPVIGADGTVYAGSYDKYVYAVNPDGTLKWKAYTGKSIYGSAAIGADGSLYIGDSVGRVMAFGDRTPVAGFTSNKVIGNPSLTVQFNDTSINIPTSWAWTFGDGSTSTEQNPSHTYAETGTYTVTLTVTNPAGSDIEEKTDYISVVTGSYTATENYYADADSYIRWGTSYQDTNYGTATTISSAIYATTDGMWTRSLVHYDLSSIPAGSAIQSATLFGYKSAGTNGPTVDAYRVTGAWTETGVTWTTQPGVAPARTSVVTSPSSGTVWLGWDVTPDVQAYISGTETNYGWLLNVTADDNNARPSSNLRCILNSRENSANSTYLRVTYTTGSGTTAPVAAFSGIPTSGTVPLTVAFTDESTNAPTAWSWTFGDGGTSTAQSPSHEYSAAGTYTVTLTATNSAGSDSEEKTGYIAVAANNMPTAAFSGSPVTGTVPLVVQFTDASTSLGSSEERVTNGGFETGNLDGWTVSSDNSAYSAYVSGIPTNHAIIGFGGPGVGTGTVTLAQDVDLTDVSSLTFSYQYAGGCEEGGTYQAEVLIGDTLVWQTTTPTESGWQAVTIDASSFSGTQSVKFRASVTGFDSPGESWLYLDDISAASEGGITSRVWNFGDGNATWSSTETTFAHIYAAAGTYTVTLTVTDTNGSDSEIKEDYITVSPAAVAPVAAFSGTPTSGPAPLTVLFTDESTNDPTSRVWDFGDGNISWSTTETTFAHTYASAANYDVTLAVENAGGSDSETKTGYITVSAVPQIDLTVSGLVNTVPASAVFAREPNGVTVVNVKNLGTDPAANVVVAVYASDVSTTVPVATTTIASLAAGATTTVTVSDPTIRNLAGGTVTYTAKLDPDNLIAETNEENNTKASSAKSLKYNGYKGKGIYWEGGSNITTRHVFDLNGNVIYATKSDAYYKAVDWTDRTETWTAAELPVPESATVEKVYLYISYNWDQTPAGVPDMNAVFNGNALTLGTPYMDISNFGAYANYEYGLYPAIDVTGMFVRNGDNTLVMTPNGDNKEALYPSTLVVIYSDPTETRRQIFINEECDELAVSLSSYGTTSDEAIAYAEFSGMAIDTANIQSATLHSFAGSAGPGEGNLTFNGVQVGTNAWQGTASTASAASFDVKNYVTADDNVAGIQGTTSGGMDALQQILVVEYTQSVIAPVAAFSATPVTGTGPLTVVYTDESANNPTSRVWDFGDGNSSWSTTETTFSHTYDAAGTYDVTLTVENSAGSDSEFKDDYITVTAGVVALPGFTDPPTDPDSDGLYEDLNANGRSDFNDVYLFYNNMAWMSENEPIAYFDFNGNARLDYNDLFVLYKEMV